MVGISWVAICESELFDIKSTNFHTLAPVCINDWIMSFDSIRDEFLLKLPPSGWAGFEGLVAVALSAIAGEPVFLAKSGWQGGIDGRSSPGAASIAFEAKRYGASSSLNDRMLLGELEELAQSDEQCPEIWLIASTVPVSAQTRVKLFRSGSSKGIHVPIIDWWPKDCPWLLVLLALAKTEVIKWLESYHSTHSMKNNLNSVLDAIIQHPSFGLQSKKLIRDVLPTYASFASAKKALTRAYFDGFKDRHEARRLFRQGLNPDAAGVVNLHRTKILGDIKKAAEKSRSEHGIVAVLGDEGVGKTWATVQTWREHFLDDMCILFSSGHIESFQNASPIYGVAHIIRSATKSYDVNSKSWEARVSTWQSAPRSDRRLFVIVDGLNERPSVPWPAFIQTMKRLVHEIGGILVITCRPRYWSSQIAPALEERVEEVLISPLAAEEIQEFLLRHKRRVEDIPKHLLPSLGNPRVLTAAIDILDELGGNDLTMDRIHWAYWKHHWRDRPDKRLSDDQFRQILVNHANKAKVELDQQGTTVIRNPRFPFSRWVEHAAVGGGSSNNTLADLFWDVVEGRFLVPSDKGASEAYSFRGEVMSFAIALKLVYDVLDDPEVLQEDMKTDEVLAKAIEPIEAFDRTAEILIAVLAIACLHPRSSEAMRRASIRAFLALQNRDVKFDDDFCAYVREAPESYMSVAKEHIKEGERGPELLVRALRTGLQRAESRDIIAKVVHGWILDEDADDPFGSTARYWAERVVGAGVQ
jgi:hypothetical protein